MMSQGVAKNYGNHFEGVPLIKGIFGTLSNI